MTWKTAGAVAFAHHQLFRINPGIPAEHALEQASLLMACVNRLTAMGATDEDQSLVWAAHLLGEMAKAIVDDVSLGLSQ
ncbi:DUF3077 domain-containing protein [Pseudomonas sp. UM16]|uniref:DUF3077 domain-containing protein n=1 Tax=Pseudomonas sp. UM16 TaxID=3158962 RepID=UPI00398F9AD5